MQDSPEKVYTRYGKRGKLGWKEKKRRQESIGSVDVDPKYPKISKEAEKEAQSSQGLSMNCSKRVFFVSLLIRDFRNKVH